MVELLVPNAVTAFPEAERTALYRAISLRRDVRHFDASRAIDDEPLMRVLQAAHEAPSVGLSQPWRFVLVRDLETRERIRASFLKCREAEAARFTQARREKYSSYRLEGIREAPLNICVVVDLRSEGEAILGTTVQPEALRASACCAVQNLWLAARAEGLGVGWVSIVEPEVLRHELGLPEGVEPIAYLCVGHPLAFRTEPMLEELGWRKRSALAEVIRFERWEPACAPNSRDAASDVAEEASAVPEPNAAARSASRARQLQLTKPPGSLGKLEELAAFWAAIRGSCPAAPPAHPTLLLFAGDHGVVVEGVSSYSSSATAMMVRNIMAGGAAVNVLAREHNVSIRLLDVGVASDLTCRPSSPVVELRDARVRGGTRNLAFEPALTLDEVRRALAVGRRAASEAIAAGATVLAVGELGIGNTTAAAAMVAALTGARAEATVGAGSGVDGAALARKVEIVDRALDRLGPNPPDALRVLQEVGGLELVAIAGVMLEAPRHRVPVVLDGYPTYAAALAARSLEPSVQPYLLASHRSAERGTAIALDSLGLTPILDLGMRLGEGTGAVLAIHLLQIAVLLERDMASFATAGIVDRIQHRG